MDLSISHSFGNFFDCNFEELTNILSSMGEPSYRAIQIWQGIYHHPTGDLSELSNLPTSLRQKLTRNFRFSSLVRIQSLNSKDANTEKSLFQVLDGNTIETVLMKYAKRNTLCISSQVGCPLGCLFCATGHMGFKRNLSSGEVVEQVAYYTRQLHQIGEKVTNIVFMGMGEPFLNYASTMKAIDCLNDFRGLNLGERRFTISTVGIIPAIYQFMEEKRQINLAISLHAADNALRSKLLPVNDKFPLEELISACKTYTKTTGRRITFEWALIDGINDTAEQAMLLTHLIKGLLCHVNIISLNQTNGFIGKGSSQRQAIIFKNILDGSGIPCTIRLKRGMDIQAGCGQLASLSPQTPPSVMI